MLIKAFKVIRSKGMMGLIQKLNTSPLRHFTKILALVTRGHKYRKRFLGASKISPSSEEKQAVSKLRQNGLNRVDALIDPALKQELIAYSNQFDSETASIELSGQHKKFWTRISDHLIENGSLTSDHIFTRFAMQPSMLRIATAYIGSVPFIPQILVTKSLPNEGPLSVSQLWHFDRDEVKMLKLFVYLTDVNSTLDGPFTLIDKNQSKNIAAGFFPRHMKDDAVLTDQDIKKHEMFGKGGSAFMVDTSQCCHMGSRVAPNHRRLLYTVLYVGLPSVHPWTEKNWIHPGKKELSELEQMLIRV